MKTFSSLIARAIAIFPVLASALKPGPEFVRINKTDAVGFPSLPAFIYITNVKNRLLSSQISK